MLDREIKTKGCYIGKQKQNGARWENKSVNSVIWGIESIFYFLFYLH